MLEHLRAHTFHGRKGAITNAFRYRVDYVLTDLSGDTCPRLFSRNGMNLWSLHDRDHGGPRGAGAGRAWFLSVLAEREAPLEGTAVLLLAQPRFLWFSFSPVSFWFLMRGEQLIAFVAEVSNTVGQRHCYFCAHPDFRPIEHGDDIRARKLMYVSPFQSVEGVYRFRVSVTRSVVDVRIDFTSGPDGVYATLRGHRAPATNRSLLSAAVRRPLGSARVTALIHWQAAKLFWKRAPFRRRTPAPPLISGSEAPDGPQSIAGE